jgi:uncharacterized membrane protein
MSVIEADSPGAEPKLALPARRCPAGAGWTWIVQGWRLFTRAPLMWILAILVWFVIAVVVHLLPVIGALAFQAVNAAIAAGFVVACRSLERGGEFELEHLFAGFRDRFVSLLVVGLLVMAGYVAIFLVFGMFFGFSILGALMTGDPNTIASSIMASALTLALGGLVALALTIPLMAAFWFAPALVIMHGLGPVQAMKESFTGCLRNWIPFLVWSIVMTIFAVVAAIPAMLGFLVWIPLAIASTYAAYRNIYTEREPDAALA